MQQNNSLGHKNMKPNDLAKPIFFFRSVTLIGNLEIRLKILDNLQVDIRIKKSKYTGVQNKLMVTAASEGNTYNSGCLLVPLFIETLIYIYLAVFTCIKFIFQDSI